jgi:hypothetical protein
MKKTMRFMLMAALTVGLSLAATSCKDDDDNNDNNGPSESESGMTIEEIQLSSLINSFGGMQAEEQLAQADWKQKTYQTQVGLVLNESRPTVRTIAVGTVDEADQQAFALLSALGIDLSNPSGFNYSNGEVGTVISCGDNTLRVSFTGGSSDISGKALADLLHGWAITVHRAQGSEWEAVVAVMPPEAGNMLSRPLVYTALTRARRHLSVVHAAGPVLARAVKHIGSIPRRTRLASLLTAEIAAIKAPAARAEQAELTAE